MQKLILLALTLSFIEKHIQGGISHSNYDLRRPLGARCVKDGQLREGKTKICQQPKLVESDISQELENVFSKINKKHSILWWHTSAPKM